MREVEGGSVMNDGDETGSIIYERDQERKCYQ